MTITEVIADTVVKLAYVGAGIYIWREWIAYLTARLKYVGAEPVPGIPVGANLKVNHGEN